MIETFLLKLNSTHIFQKTLANGGQMQTALVLKPHRRQRALVTRTVEYFCYIMLITLNQRLESQNPLLFPRMPCVYFSSICISGVVSGKLQEHSAFSCTGAHILRLYLYTPLIYKNITVNIKMWKYFNIFSKMRSLLGVRRISCHMYFFFNYKLDYIICLTK